MLARGSGIAALQPLIGEAFSRRALYRHRQKHMSSLGEPEARPVPFPYDGTAIERIKWLQREVEQTAAIAKGAGNLSAKVKAIHEMTRLVWLEPRLAQNAEDDDAIDRESRKRIDRIDRETEASLMESRERRLASLASNRSPNEGNGFGT